MVDKNTITRGKEVFIITHGKRNLTMVHKAIVTGIQDDHIVCELVDNAVLKVCKIRRPSQVFLSFAEAALEQEQFVAYLAARMSTHKTK